MFKIYKELLKPKIRKYVIQFLNEQNIWTDLSSKDIHMANIYIKSVQHQMSLLLFSPSVVSNSFDPMDYSTPDFPVPHYLLELAQIHLHWVCDAIQPSHPLSSPYPPALNLFQHQSLFQWVSSSHQVAKGHEDQLKAKWNTITLNSIAPKVQY